MSDTRHFAVWLCGADYFTMKAVILKWHNLGQALRRYEKVCSAGHPTQPDLHRWLNIK